MEIGLKILLIGCLNWGSDEKSASYNGHTGCGNNITETLTTNLLLSTAVAGTSLTTLKRKPTDCLPKLCGNL